MYVCVCMCACVCVCCVCGVTTSGAILFVKLFFIHSHSLPAAAAFSRAVFPLHNNTWVHECMSVQVHGRMDVWVYGCIGV